MNTRHSKHPGDILLDHIEGRLPSKRAQEVEDHLRGCPQCAEEARELKSILMTLKEKKSVHCPEPWRIYEYAESGADADGTISEHLGICPLCAAELKGFNAPAGEAKMPAGVRRAFEEKFQSPARESIGSGLFQRTLEGLKDFMNAQTLAMGSVVAAALLLLLIIPGGGDRLIAPKTGVDWNKPFDGKGWASKGIRKETRVPNLERAISEGSRKTRVAVILLIQGSQTYEQDWVDSLYKAIRPRGELARQYRFVTPASMENLFSKQPSPFSNISEFLAKLDRKEGIARALLMTLLKKGDSYDLENILADTRTGKTLAKSSRRDVSRKDLAKELRTTALPMLEKETGQGF
jgi:hypothetical protein